MKTERHGTHHHVVAEAPSPLASLSLLSTFQSLPMFVLCLMSRGFVVLRRTGRNASTPSSQKQKSCIFFLTSKTYRYNAHGFCN